MAEREVKDWWDDDQHPLYIALAKAMLKPWLYMDQGWPQVNCPVWAGRGLAGEVGSRVYHSLRRERMGWWPPVLDDFEQLLEEQ